MTFLFIALVITTIVIFNLPVFGKHPSGNRLNKIKSAANYTNGEFKNQSHTPTKPDNVTYWMMIKAMLKGNKDGSPKLPLPHHQSDFSPSADFKLTWFGHSSYLIQVDNLNILVDPIFNERPSPFQFIGTKQFAGTDFISIEDLPSLDIVLISHDHYDHLEQDSILKLKDKTKMFITSLGVGAHLEFWGIPKDKIIELNWGDQVSPLANIKLTAAPARHFSGRLFKRNQTLWSSFILQTSNNKIYIGADSGYDHHFKTIGDEHGPFDLAILECGQYNTMWPFIHMMPEQVAQASLDLNAKYLLPVHWAKYKLALHNWDEPILRLKAKADEQNVQLLTPHLGETFTLNGNLPKQSWWLNL
ncbi:MAG: MBL fold metallo-hydrolase [Pedobacter sp.]|nr:MAG: MBL fold metallo-hydrolase [Pedobacter sp.]